MSVTLSVFPQERTSVRMEVDALLDTGSLAGYFTAEGVVVRYNLKSVLSDTSYTVCSGFDNRCLESNTILLLRVTYFEIDHGKMATYKTWLPSPSITDVLSLIHISRDQVQIKFVMK